MAGKCRYDLAIGIGGACSCSQALREAGLQFASFPFDWVLYSDIRTRVDQIRDDFADWLPKDALEDFMYDASNTGAIKRNVRTGVVFAHDFHRDVSFDEEWTQVSAKYRRRADRMYNKVSSSRRVLLMWVDVKYSPAVTDEDCAYVLKTFRGRWPNVAFELLRLSYDKGRAFDDRTECEAGDVRTVAFDYRDYSNPGWIADFKLIGRWLRREYSVRDYRTAEERASGRRLEKAKRYARFNANGFWVYLRTKCEYKLFTHLRKRLQRRGII